MTVVTVKTRLVLLLDVVAVRIRVDSMNHCLSKILWRLVIVVFAFVVRVDAGAPCTDAEALLVVVHNVVARIVELVVSFRYRIVSTTAAAVVLTAQIFTIMRAIVRGTSV